VYTPASYFALLKERVPQKLPLVCYKREKHQVVSPKSLDAGNFAGEEMSVSSTNFECIRELLQYYAHECYAEETTNIKKINGVRAQKLPQTVNNNQH
jgi:hypothetical protein